MREIRLEEKWDKIKRKGKEKVMGERTKENVEKKREEESEVT